MGYSWDHTPYDLGAISCYRLGMYRRALAYAEEACAISPADERLKNNKRLIESKLQEIQSGA